LFLRGAIVSKLELPSTSQAITSRRGGPAQADRPPLRRAALCCAMQKPSWPLQTGSRPSRCAGDSELRYRGLSTRGEGL